MKITINVKKGKAAFFLELLRSFDFITIEKAHDIDEELTQEHKDILDQRLASYKSDPDNLVDWEEFKNQKNQKSK